MKHIAVMSDELVDYVATEYRTIKDSNKKHGIESVETFEEFFNLRMLYFRIVEVNTNREKVYSWQKIKTNLKQLAKCVSREGRCHRQQ